jgi:hypothetical protein
MKLEGYASLFGEADLVGDVVRAGAFARSIRERPVVPMLVRHNGRWVAGAWRLFEDQRGLLVRGEIEPDKPAATMARRLLRKGVDGLSIGFNTRVARARAGGGRELHDIDLIEVSLVDTPMAPRARLFRAGGLPAAKT